MRAGIPFVSYVCGVLEGEKIFSSTFDCGQIAPANGYPNEMSESPSFTTDLESLLRHASGGDDDARGQLFAHYRDRLRRMVLLRMDRRLQGRLDPSDVLQEAYITYAKRLTEYAEDRPMPFFLWLRLITGQKLIDLHRHHLGAKMRTANQEISLNHGAIPQATSVSLAAQLLGKVPSPSQAASWAETKRQVQDALNNMAPIDREVLALRHFEGLSNSETAEVLGLKKAAASNRYIRALQRLKEILSSVPDLADGLFM